MSEHATISTDILARYAADAAREVDGVRGLVESHLPLRRGVLISDDNGRITVELRVALDWGASIPAVGREVQEHVAEYLQRLADVGPATIEVVVDEIGPPS